MTNWFSLFDWLASAVINAKHNHHALVRFVIRLGPPFMLIVAVACDAAIPAGLLKLLTRRVRHDASSTPAAVSGERGRR